MAFTQAQLDTLEEAIAQGALSVKYQDKVVTYRSLDEMLKIRDLMRMALGRAHSRKRLKFYTSRGLK